MKKNDINTNSSSLFQWLSIPRVIYVKHAFLSQLKFKLELEIKQNDQDLFILVKYRNIEISLKLTKVKKSYFLMLNDLQLGLWMKVIESSMWQSIIKMLSSYSVINRTKLRSNYYRIAEKSMLFQNTELDYHLRIYLANHFVLLFELLLW